MYILNPDPYCLPSYRISPFTTKDLGKNEGFRSCDLVDKYLADRFPGSDITYTENGRKAINLALNFYQLAKDDVVTIFTTSGNVYISSCVTNEILKVCKWSRQIEPNTKLIFVNHEFGFPYKDIKHLKQYALPIIEDCAHTFYSEEPEKSIGTMADFVVYSVPKIFPIQVGGLLQCNVEGYKARYTLEQPLEKYIKNVMSNYINDEETIISKRIRNYQHLQKSFLSLGFETRFELTVGIVPGVFMFRINDSNFDLQRLKEHFYAHGIQCSVFYGERAFFIPCHQALEIADLDYFTAVMNDFISKQKIHD